VTLDHGGVVTSTDAVTGRVAATVHPWEIALAPAASEPSGSAQNRLEARVTGVTHIGNRVRVALEAGQPLVAEVTEPALHDLALAPGALVTASWKAAATRLVPL
jgi:molybdate transport system ATP-binding protein